MYLKFPAIVICFALLSTFVGCVDEELNVATIKFPSIVGTYSGFTRVCTQMGMSTDTTCSKEFDNKIKIFISNEKTIVIEDDLGVYGKTMMSYIKTENTTDGAIHYFDKQDTLKSLNLVFDVTNRAISVEQLSNDDSSQLFELFFGRK